MMFKKPKQDVIDGAHGAAMNSVYANLNSGTFVHSTPSSWAVPIQSAIELAIRKAIESLVNDMYTDDEFEEDIGLREKNATKR